jgi:Gas vesicle protein K
MTPEGSAGPTRGAAARAAGAAAGAPGTARGRAGSARQRLEGSGEDVGRSLGRLVVTLLEVVRQVIERQALRRVDAGGLSDDQVEDLGRALIELEETFDELRDTFGVREEDLFLPIDVRRLLDAERGGGPQAGRSAEPPGRRDDRPARLTTSQNHWREDT